MTKNLLTLLTLICLCSLSAHSQETKKDSLELVKKAKADADNFKLNKADLKAFRRHRADYRSMYLNVPNTNPSTFPPKPFIKVTVLSPAEMIKKRLGYNKVDYYAGYFEPTKATTPDTSLLQDSVYVRTFRDVAYRKTINRKPAIFYVGIGVAVVGAAAIIYVIAELFATAG